MKSIFAASFVLLLPCLAPGALAGDAKVTFLAPEKFTDILSGDESLEDAQKTVTKEFGQIFSRLGKKLPDGYHLEVSVTDIDLAGAVRYSRIHQVKNIRIVKDTDWPRIKFSYTIKDASQNVLASGTEDLRDLGFAHNQFNTSNSEFKFEEQMLRDWFRHRQVAQQISYHHK